MFTKRIPIDVRFRSGFTPRARGECWNWVGRPTNEGYGNIRMAGRRGKMVLAHRFAYEYFIGKIPMGKCVCHRCDNRLCVNPNHLFIGTIQDNNADRDGKGRCRTGWVPGELCGQHKLTEPQVLAILQSSETHQRLADRYKVARTTITNIKTGRTWLYFRAIGKWKD